MSVRDLQGNDVTGCKWCEALQARDWQTVEALSDSGAPCTCEKLSAEEIAAIRLRLNDPAQDPNAFIAEATWHGLFRRGFLTEHPYGAQVTPAAIAALAAQPPPSRPTSEVGGD